MEYNEYKNQCFSDGEIIILRGHRYKFIKIQPNQPNHCALYTESTKRIGSFCELCGGCSRTFPPGTCRGVFKLIG